MPPRSHSAKLTDASSQRGPRTVPSESWSSLRRRHQQTADHVMPSLALGAAAYAAKAAGLAATDQAAAVSGEIS